jgi:glycosyltransferase involved in cell wall biosynthesis
VRTAEKRRLIVIGPVPPPIHGVAVSTLLALENPVLRGWFRVEHVDTSDHRSSGNIGKWDVVNVLLALRHAWALFRRTRSERGVVYLPLSQNTAAFLRDSLFIHVATLSRWRVAAHLRGGEFRDFYTSRPWPLRIWIRFSLRRLESIAVMGASLRSLFEGVVPGERIAVVPNGTPDVGLVEDAPRDETVLFLSNLRRRKGVVEALEAALLVVREHPTARFVFVGEWEDVELERTLRARAREANGRIHFLRPVAGDAKRELLLSSSIFLFPPVQPEGHPRVVLEAMAAGLPVVTTDRGAIAETVTDGETGFVLGEPAPDRLADCVLSLLRDGALRKSMADASRRRYLSCFTQSEADRVLADWLNAVAAGADR